LRLSKSDFLAFGFLVDEVQHALGVLVLILIRLKFIV
jgi:hypothetical protein